MRFESCQPDRWFSSWVGRSCPHPPLLSSCGRSDAAREKWDPPLLAWYHRFLLHVRRVTTIFFRAFGQYLSSIYAFRKLGKEEQRYKTFKEYVEICSSHSYVVVEFIAPLSKGSSPRVRKLRLIWATRAGQGHKAGKETRPGFLPVIIPDSAPWSFIWLIFTTARGPL